MNTDGNPAPGPAFICGICGWIYDPEEGMPVDKIVPGTPFAALPAGWVCPICWAEKEEFRPLAGNDEVAGGRNS